jgi:cobalt-precorrin-5B (C1)-methyltransferase
MIAGVVEELASAQGLSPDFRVTVSVPGGNHIAQKTWNPRLGIVGGLSILGTTGIVIPYSCAAWIHSIQRGIDVARALGLTHVVGSTGDVSEKAAMARLGLPIEAYVDMGDFAGGMLKYLKAHPVEQATIAGGFAKIAKLAQGALDLHSARSTVDLHNLAEMLQELGLSSYDATRVRAANSANEVLGIATEAGLPLGDMVARRARDAAQRIAGGQIRIDVLVVDRAGTVAGVSG